MRAPKIRIRAIGEVESEKEYVLYWMIAFRRPRHNFALQHAIAIANELDKPLLVFEPLRAHYKWSSPRLHQFVIQGMRDNQNYFRQHDVSYYPYVEPKHPNGRKLLEQIAKKACAVVSDDFPCFFLPRMVQAAKKVIPCRFELVDSNGLIPLRAPDKTFYRAYDFRRFMQKNIAQHWDETPMPDPVESLENRTPVTVDSPTHKRADIDELLAGGIEKIPLLTAVPVVEMVGGFVAAQTRLEHFISNGLNNYENRNHPDQDAASGLSPYLHFGHISAHHVFKDVTESSGWCKDDVAEKAKGQREGWWGAPSYIESFLDELISWREVGFNMCSREEDFDQYSSLPNWALESLEQHRTDKREWVYSLEEFELAQTHDEIWNAAQRQLVRDGIIHNYLRMLWGKKILHWTESPEVALEIMIELNNKYALDGRDPNSYSGIFWVLGRYDRAWAEREIFGKVRYMTSDSTRKKLKLKNYLEEFGDNTQLTLGEP